MSSPVGAMVDDIGPPTVVFRAMAA